MLRQDVVDDGQADEGVLLARLKGEHVVDVVVLLIVRLLLALDDVLNNVGQLLSRQVIAFLTKCLNHVRI